MKKALVTLRVKFFFERNFAEIITCYTGTKLINRINFAEIIRCHTGTELMSYDTCLKRKKTKIMKNGEQSRENNRVQCLNCIIGKIVI